MLKKVVLLVCLLGSLFAADVSKSQVMEAVKANPALLDTPQAQAKMAEAGVDKATVMEKIANTDTTQTTNSKEDAASNSITVDAAEAKKIDDAAKQQESNNLENKNVTNSAYINPFAYKSNNVLLQELTRKQSYKTNNKLSRYGLNFFKNKNNQNIAAMPVPSYYILNYGDALGVWLYGASNDNITLKIDNNGDVSIPKIGPVKIAGKSFGDVEKILKDIFQKNYPNTKVSINMSQYTTIQVSLVGDVSAPGVYNVNSLSTVKDLLIEAKGVKNSGSLRDIIIKRDGKVLAILDFYKLLKSGDESLSVLLKSGDIIFVPKVNKVVTIDGEVTNPAKFELKKDENLNTLLDYAGGLKFNGSKYGFLIKRYIKNETTKTFEVDYDQASKFKLSDGDNVYVYGVDKVHKESVYLLGNVVRPGERELSTAFSLKQLLQSEIAKLTLKGVFLENTLFDYALIKRKTDTLDREILSFDLKDVLDGTKDIKLKNDDQIYIFNRYNSNIAPYVTIKGTPIGQAGKYGYYAHIKVKDLINIAGSTPYSKIKLTTYDTDDLMPHIAFVDENYTLAPFDEVEVYDYYMTNPITTITVSGAVNLPNKYVVDTNMTLLKAIDAAGGFQINAYKKEFQVVRYKTVNDEKVRSVYRLGFDEAKNYKLQKDDEITVFKIPDSLERPVVHINGEIRNAGAYDMVNDDMTLMQLVNIAGGFTLKAFKNEFEVVRYSIQNDERTREVQRVKLDEASRFRLKNYDEITVFTIPNWNERKTVILKGEVKFPGIYTIETGEKLASVIKRAGGFTENAFITGIVFSRESVKENEEKRMKESIAKLKQQVAYVSGNAREAGQSSTDANQMIQMVNILDKQAQEFKALGRISIQLDSNLTTFENSSYNLRLEDKDTLIVPTYKDTVSVYGEVLNQNTFVFDPDLNAQDYIQKAGGLTQKADDESLYVVLPTGEAKRIIANCFLGCNDDVPQGSSIIVPMQLKFTSNILFWKDVSQVVYQLAITAASLNTLGAI